MSSGFGVVPLDFIGALGGIADRMSKQEKERRKLDTLARLGGQLKLGDYSGAAGTAFDAGDAETGIGLLKLGQTHDKDARQQSNAELVGRALPGLFGGYGGDDGSGGPQSPLGSPSLGPRSDRSVPAFADMDGPSAGYQASLFKRESNNDPNAQASTSSARGLGQFTRGTWNQLAGQRPDLQLTPVGGGQDGRVDREQMVRATTALTEQNEDVLRRSNLPVTDATRYSLHIFGSGGGRRFVAGTLANPDRPAASIVNADQVAANRNVFFHRDGQAKTAGEVMNDFSRSFGGGAAPAPRQRAPGVDFAESEGDVQRLEQRMGMVPPQLAYDPRADMPAEGAMPTIAQAPQLQGSGFGVPPLQAGGFQRPGLPSSDPNAQNFPSSTGSLAPSVNNTSGGVLAGARARGAPPSVSASDVPPAPGLAPLSLNAPVPGRTMSLPEEAGGPPVQVAQNGGLPEVPSDARIGNVPVQRLQGIPTTQRLGVLSRMLSLDLPEGQQAMLKELYRAALDETKMPDGVKAFVWAKRNGMTQANSPAEYERESKGPMSVGAGSSLYGQDSRLIATAPNRETENKVSADIEARKAGAADLGLRPGSPAYQSYVLTGKMPREDQQPLSASDKKAILEADDAVASAETAISNLTQAKVLSAKAYEGPTAGVRGQITGYFGNEAGQSTQELDNLVTTNALGQLKAIFGAAPTEGERKILLEIQGSSSLPHALRVKIYDRANELAGRRLELNKQRAAELRGQTYYKPGGGSPETRGSDRALPAPSPSNRPGAANAAGRFNDLVGSGLSKEQAYQQLQSEGY